MASGKIDEIIILDYSTKNAAGSVIPTQFPNAKFNKPSSDIWARLTIQEGDAEQGEIGGIAGTTLLHRTNGVVMVQLFDPLEEGTANIMAKAEEIAGFLRAVKLLFVGGGGHVQYRAPSVQTIGRGDDNEHMWQVNVVCPFLADSLDLLL